MRAARPRLRRVAAPVLAALLLGAAFVDLPARALPAAQPAPARRAPARALLWKVSDADNHLYLLGSFHVLKADDYPLPPAIDAAFADAERVAFEVSPAEMRSPDLPAKMLAAGVADDGRTLQQRVSPATWTRLEAYCSRRDIPVAGLQRFKPWMAALVISLSEASRLGYAPDKGLDQTLIDRSLAAGKPGTGLESADQQIAALAGMDAAEQEQSLLEALSDADDAKARMDELHEDWRRGDAVALERLMARELRDQYPALYQRINVARNDAWVPKLRAMLDGPGRDDTLVIVGSMHLVGADGLVEKLRKAGYRVERL